MLGTRCCVAVLASLALLSLLGADTPASRPTAPAVAAERVLPRTDTALDRPAWGAPVDGVRLGAYVVLRDVETAGWNELCVVLHNTAAEPRILSLGLLLGNGRQVIPDALRLVMHDRQGRDYRLWACCQVAGRVDPWLVVLAPGASYTYRTNLAEFRDERLTLAAAASAPADLPTPHPPPGEYTLRVTLHAAALDAHGLNSDVPGLATWRMFTGDLASGAVRLQVQPMR